jgi:hypothetical protein
LTVGETNSLIREAGDLGFRVLGIAGEGEPLLDDNLPRIIHEANRSGLIPYIFTNGSRLDYETARYMKNHGASLVINLDSLSEEKYERMNEVDGSFDTVMRNLQIAKEMFSDTYSEIGGHSLRRIAINTVVSGHNIDEVFLNRHWCGEDVELQPFSDFCGGDFVLVYNTPMATGRAASDSGFTLTGNIEEKIASSGVIPLGTISDGSWCAYMRNGISVGAGGEVLLCPYSLESAGALGNVRDSGLGPHLGVANSVVDGFYEKNGHARCILRHPKYIELIEELKKNAN